MAKLAGVLAVAMILCGALSTIVGDWPIAAWFIGAILTACLYVYGNSPPTYLMVGLAAAWIYVLFFTDLIAQH
jgi:hypothetical protein